MTTQKTTIGQAIDQVLGALSSLDTKEQRTVLQTVCSHLDLNLPAGPIRTPFVDQKISVPAPAASATQAGTPSGAETELDIRTLKDQKQPESARQMACIVAYYLLDHAPDAEKKKAITSDDLENYFKQANFKLPRKLEQLLIDCKAAGYFEAVAR